MDVQTLSCYTVQPQPKGAVMIGERVEHFEGTGTDLSVLQSHIEGYLRQNGFTVQTSAPSALGTSFRRGKEASSPDL
jgi:hypothetical protein